MRAPVVRGIGYVHIWVDMHKGRNISAGSRIADLEAEGATMNVDQNGLLSATGNVPLWEKNVQAGCWRFSSHHRM